MTWEHDPQTDKWTRKKELPITFILQGSLSAFSIGGYGYLYDCAENYLYQYNPEIDTFLRKADFPGENNLHVVSFTINNKGYIGTGSNSDGTENTSQLWEYDPDYDSWARKKDFPGSARNGAVGFVIKNCGYIGLGNASGVHPRDFWRYNALNDTWAQIDSCGFAAHGAFGFSVGNKGYVGCGVFLSEPEFWEYTPQFSGISEEKLSSGIQLYPNPASDWITISTELKNIIKVSVTDIYGRVLQTYTSVPGEINLSGMAAGIYFMRVETGDEVVSIKFIKRSGF